LEKIHPLLHPGMVILTHKEYEFTNLFIKGYWTHAAMAVSHDQIVEATGNGVEARSLHDFIICHDDYIILRPTFCGPDTMVRASEYVRQVVGFPSNYRFMPGGRNFYCAELVYWAYLRSCEHRGCLSSRTRELKRIEQGQIVNPQQIFESTDQWEHVSNKKS
jgi:uncharacterized protein YycO